MLCRRNGFCWGVVLSVGALVFAGLPCAAQEGRVWVSYAETNPGPSAHIDMELPPAGVPHDEPLVFDTAVVCNDSFDEVAVRLTVTDSQGRLLHEGEVATPLKKGSNPVRFIWEPQDLPDGVYAVRIAVRHPFIEHVAEQELRLEKISWTSLNGAITQATTAMAEAVAHADAAEQGAATPSVQPKVAIGNDAAVGARVAANAGEWPLALYLARHAEQAAREIEAALAFASTAPETGSAVALPDPGAIEIAGSLLEADGRPVFLIGGYLEHPDTAAVERLRRYGLNFASLSVRADAEKSNNAALDSFLDTATASGVAVAVSARALELPEGAPTDGNGGQTVDLNSEAARQATAAHVTAVSEAIGTHPALTALSVATSPHFSFGGEAVRAAFVERVETVYGGDRLALNRAWQSNLQSFNDIGIWPDDVHLSYQYDWQTFHQELAGRYVRSLLDIADQAAGVPVTVTFGEEMLSPGESRNGVDQGQLAPDLPLITCVSRDVADDPHLALPYPHSELLISLLHSMNPKVPLLNLAHVTHCPDLYGPTDRRAYVRSLLWEDVIVGANAVALAPWPGEWNGMSKVPVGLDPQCLEGAAMAAEELNRLAPIVAALQREPIEVAIVWSPASKIQNDGIEYLQSIRNAYEGCSYSGRRVGFISEAQLAAGNLGNVGVLVLPRLMAISEAAFGAVDDYIAAGGAVIRTADPIPYTEHGQDLQDVLTLSTNLVLVRGRDTAVQYMQAMDAIGERLGLPPVAHARNAHGYLLEGVRTSYALHEGVGYLYVLNMRHEPVQLYASHNIASGRDLVHGRDITFPMGVQPLTPMLIRLDSLPAPEEAPLVSPTTVPTAIVEPVADETDQTPPLRIQHPKTGRGK
jgi:hypothetical protein